ncbi:MAG: type II secretion system F family protein [Bauldia sp.]|nr:type II secretion system F family protein [Bauldia sp.]
MTVIALAVLAFLAVGGVIYAIFFNRVRGRSSADQRREAITERSGNGAKVVAAADSAARRRRSVQESLKEMEAKEKARASQRKSPPLALRMQQAGLNWSKSTFWLFGAGAGAVFFALAFYFGAPLLACVGFAVAGVLGFPYWFVNFRRKRRFKAFIAEFPNSVDVIVRGVKAGLPLNDCLRIIGAESQEPVRTEFRMIAERQTMGLTTSEAINGLTERVPLPEANFFAIAITIQQQAGGNLSEALGNLSKVLRERAKMRGKIKAMSTEAKASAWIIGSLPIVVMFLVYMTNPEYIMLLFTESVGNVILIASAFWMSIGVFVMKRMINFEI